MLLQSLFRAERTTDVCFACYSIFDYIDSVFAFKFVYISPHSYVPVSSSAKKISAGFSISRNRIILPISSRVKNPLFSIFRYKVTSLMPKYSASSFFDTSRRVNCAKNFLLLNTNLLTSSLACPQDYNKACVRVSQYVYASFL